jgi:hypothetical protein
MVAILIGCTAREMDPWDGLDALSPDRVEFRKRAFEATLGPRAVDRVGTGSVLPVVVATASAAPSGTDCLGLPSGLLRELWRQADDACAWDGSCDQPMCPVGVTAAGFDAWVAKASKGAGSVPTRYRLPVPPNDSLLSYESLRLLPELVRRSAGDGAVLCRGCWHRLARVVKHQRDPYVVCVRRHRMWRAQVYWQVCEAHYRVWLAGRALPEHEVRRNEMAAEDARSREAEETLLRPLEESFVKVQLSKLAEWQRMRNSLAEAAEREPWVSMELNWSLPNDFAGGVFDYAAVVEHLPPRDNARRGLLLVSFLHDERELRVALKRMEVIKAVSNETTSCIWPVEDFAVVDSLSQRHVSMRNAGLDSRADAPWTPLVTHGSVPYRESAMALMFLRGDPFVSARDVVRRRRQALDATQAYLWSMQLVRGVAELHDVDMAHGGVSLASTVCIRPFLPTQVLLLPPPALLPRGGPRDAVPGRSGDASPSVWLDADVLATARGVFGVGTGQVEVPAYPGDFSYAFGRAHAPLLAPLVFACGRSRAVPSERVYPPMRVVRRFVLACDARATNSRSAAEAELLQVGRPRSRQRPEAAFWQDTRMVQRFNDAASLLKTRLLPLMARPKPLGLVGRPDGAGLALAWKHVRATQAERAEAMVARASLRQLGSVFGAWRFWAARRRHERSAEAIRGFWRTTRRRQMAHEAEAVRRGEAATVIQRCWRDYWAFVLERSRATPRFETEAPVRRRRVLSDRQLPAPEPERLEVRPKGTVPASDMMRLWDTDTLPPLAGKQTRLWSLSRPDEASSTAAAVALGRQFMLSMPTMASSSGLPLPNTTPVGERLLPIHQRVLRRSANNTRKAGRTLLRDPMWKGHLSDVMGPEGDG